MELIIILELVRRFFGGFSVNVGQNLAERKLKQ